MGHHGGKGVREECDTVESWSRGAEPSLLVDRLKLLSNILAPVSCVTVAEGTKLLGEKFFDF